MNGELISGQADRVNENQTLRKFWRTSAIEEDRIPPCGQR